MAFASQIQVQRLSRHMGNGRASYSTTLISNFGFALACVCVPFPGILAAVFLGRGRGYMVAAAPFFFFFLFFFFFFFSAPGAPCAFAPPFGYFT